MTEMTGSRAANAHPHPPTEAQSIHTCSYQCDRPACVKAQRDEMRDRAEAQAQGGGEVLDRGFKFENGVHTPTVLVGFAPNDWKARDAFAASITPQAAPLSAPVGVEDAWQEGYRQGVLDERTSEVNIGVAGFNAKVEPARVNPYLAQQPAAVDEAMVDRANQAFRDHPSTAYGVPREALRAAIEAALAQPQGERHE